MIQRSERKAWAREHFRGFENVLIPSFSADMQDLNEEAIRLDVRQGIAHGFFSSLVALESGMRPEEQRRMLKIACDEADGKTGISLSLCGETLADNIAMLEYAESVGASHALLCYPQNFRPGSQAEIVDFVTALAGATNLGLVLFASDKFSLRHLHPSGVPFDAYEQLADVSNVVGLKLGGMDAGMILECFERFNDRLMVTSVNFGMLPMLVQNFGLQWSGAWTVEALQSPAQPYAVSFLEHLRRGEMEKAMAIYWKLTPVLGAMAQVMAPAIPTGTYNWSLCKYQQWLSGGNGGMTRQPCMRVYQRDMTTVRRGLAQVGIECPDDDADFFRGRVQ